MRSIRSERGASAVELALCLTVLVLLVFGTIQFGIAYNRYQGLQAAAREGARIASIGGSQAEVAGRVRQAQSLFTAADVQVRIDYSTDDGTSWPGGNTICDDASGGNRCIRTTLPSPCGQAAIGNLVRVTATVPGQSKYAVVIPMWGNANITYVSRGVFRCEQIS